MQKEREYNLASTAVNGSPCQLSIRADRPLTSAPAPCVELNNNNNNNKDTSATSGDEEDSSCNSRRKMKTSEKGNATNKEPSSALKRPREESADPTELESLQDEGTGAAAVTSNRSERKRSREKRRRSELNTGLDSLATLLYTIEPKLKSPLSAGKGLHSDEAEGQTAISNRVELINFTVKVMTRLHEENEARKLVISDLTGGATGYPSHLPQLGPGHRDPRSGEDRRLHQGNNGSTRNRLLPPIPTSVLSSLINSSSDARHLPQEASARERALTQHQLVSMMEEEQMRLTTLHQQERRSAAVEQQQPNLQQSLQFLREQSLSSRSSGMGQGGFGAGLGFGGGGFGLGAGRPQETLDALSLLQTRGGLPGAGLGAGSIMDPSLMLLSAAQRGRGLPDLQSSSFNIQDLLSGANGLHFQGAASQLLLQHHRDSSGLPGASPAGGGSTSDNQQERSDSTAAASAPWDPSAVLLRGKRGRGQRGRPPSES
jgi:hypothetical protein